MKKIFDWISKNPLFALVIFILLLVTGFFSKIGWFFRQLGFKKTVQYSNSNEPEASFEELSDSSSYENISNQFQFYLMDVDGNRYKAKRENGIIYIYDSSSGSWLNLVQAGFVAQSDGKIRKLSSANNENRYRDFSNVK